MSVLLAILMYLGLALAANGLHMHPHLLAYIGIALFCGGLAGGLDRS